MPSTLVILNPAAGDQQGQNVVRQWAENLEHLTLWPTRASDDAKHFASQAVEMGFARVIAAGGDGTLHEVVNGLAENFDAIEFGVVPLGTGNDFARNMGISLDPFQALKDIEHVQAVPEDVVRIQDGNGNRPPTYFLNAASGGFSRVLHETLTRDLKARLGPLAYLIAAGKALRRIPWCKATVTADDRTMNLHCCAIVAANGQYLAGGAHMAPWAKPNDGTIELIIVSAANLWQRFVLTIRFYLDKHLSSKRVTYAQARDVRIESKPSMDFMCDGEPAGTTPLEIEVLHGVLRVLRPPRPESG